MTEKMMEDNDRELYELVRSVYVDVNKEYLEEQLKICDEKVRKMQSVKTNENIMS